MTAPEPDADTRLAEKIVEATEDRWEVVRRVQALLTEARRQDATIIQNQGITISQQAERIAKAESETQRIAIQRNRAMDERDKAEAEAAAANRYCAPAPAPSLPSETEALLSECERELIQLTRGHFIGDSAAALLKRLAARRAPEPPAPSGSRA